MKKPVEKFVELTQKNGLLIVKEIKGKNFEQTVTGSLIGEVDGRLKRFARGDWGILNVEKKPKLNPALKSTADWLNVLHKPSPNLALKSTADWLNVLHKPSPNLAVIVGDKPLRRTEAVQRVWKYVKDNNLQDPKNRRNINCDDKLKAIFGGKAFVNMFEMTKIINRHLTQVRKA